ncbi:glycosyltransferase family 39 protein [Candidatus Woesearchaeota archaeon]|nr:glycosyltransferase family 39 protein [Candidatus Woesearchaeota archaeon]
MKDRFDYKKAALITIAIAIAIRLALVFLYHPAGDACWHFSASRFIAEEGNLPSFEALGRDEPFWPSPLFHIIAAFSYRMAGDFGMKLVSPLFASLTLVFSYLIFKKLFDEKTSFYSILFLSFIPIGLDYSTFGYVEAALSFFVILSIYFALEGSYYLAAVSAGLSMLTKYNGAFVIPLMLFIAYTRHKGDNKAVFGSFSKIIIISAAIAAPWHIRNWLLLGNPVWPFLNFLFHGIQQASYSAFDLSRFLHPNVLIYPYLGFFGVPDGVLSNIFFIKLPFIKIIFAGWLLATVIFTLPLAFGFFNRIDKDNETKNNKEIKNKKKINNEKSILIAWILFFLIQALIYIPNTGWSVSRFFLPALPAIAAIWAVGILWIFNRTPKYSLVIKSLLIIIAVGFVFTAFFKISYAANSWNKYNDDFGWIKENTEKNSAFIFGGQCGTYSINRQSYQPTEENIEKTDYAFVNQEFPLDARTKIDGSILAEIEAKKLIYENKNTGTKVYSLREKPSS